MQSSDLLAAGEGNKFIAQPAGSSTTTAFVDQR